MPSLLHRLLTFPDARGRPVHIWHVYRTEWACTPPRLRRLCMAFAVIAIALSVSMPVMVARKAPTSRATRRAMVFATTTITTSVAIAFVSGVFSVRLHHAKFVRRLLLKGRCPACGYSLVDLSPLLEGPAAPAIICPECNGAWPLEL